MTEAGILTGFGKSVLYAIILGLLGMPSESFAKSKGITDDDIRTNPNLYELAERIVSTSNFNEKSHKTVEEAIAALKTSGVDTLSSIHNPGTIGSPQAKPKAKSPEQDLANNHSYLKGRLSTTQQAQSGDYDIIIKVGKANGLSGMSLKILLAIRVLENGPPGMEMGVGDGNPDHPGRRLSPEKVGGVKNFSHQKSLSLQAEWAAGTIKKRFPTGKMPLKDAVTVLGQRYCELPEKWTNNIYELILTK